MKKILFARNQTPLLKIKYIESLNKYNGSEMQIFNRNFVKSRYFLYFYYKFS